MRRRKPVDAPTVVLLYCEYGDEVNGIARSTRELMRVLQSLGKDALFLTPAHSSRNRLEWETPGVGVIPQAAGIDTPGYPGAEMAFPRLRTLLDILRERKVTHVDILTPSLGCILMAPIFRALGLSLSSQYRTDIFAYAKHLGIPPPVMALSHFFVGRFLASSRRIGVPSESCLALLAGRYPRLRDRMSVLRRGLPHGFEAERRKVEERRLRFVARSPDGPRRFFFLGRISREKNLALLAAAWKGDPLLANCRLDFLGDGPYREGLAAAFAGLPATFAGVVPAAAVAERICEMDFLVFPSGTDTMGQAVLESLCMGIPALVSDRGGPAELVTAGENGFVLPVDDVDAWSACLRRCAAMGAEEYGRMSQKARAAALSLDPEAAAGNHWRHWQDASRPAA